MLDRRSFLSSSAAIAAGSIATPLFAQTIKPNTTNPNPGCEFSPTGPSDCPPSNSPSPSPINQSILTAHVVTARNLQTALFGSGADASVISAHATAASTLFSDAASTGATAQINSIIAANASALNSFGTSLTDAQLETLYTSILPMLPGLTQGDVDVALRYLAVPSGTAQSLPSQGVVPQQNSFLSLLGQAASSVGGGVIVASEGIRPRPPRLKEAHCYGYYVALFLFAASAFLTDGLSAGVIWGVEVTWSQIFGAGALLGGALANTLGC